ncbi:MAG TPA: TolC family protein [Candidatus Methylomirabilis sp.]|nr:TolC family protein [Candidatus Methylomirabilis sp.]
MSTCDALARGLATLAAVGVLHGGCSALPFSAAWDPFAAAPPTPTTPWRSADGNKQPRMAPLVDRLNKEVHIDPDKEHRLADLIDLAQRLNPETWRAWEEARAAAARLGRSESAWFPTLAAMAAGGTSRVVEKAAPESGAVPVYGPEITPSIQLSWILVDFGRRQAAVEQAGWEVMAANLRFNRKHQEVAFNVSESYFTLDARRAQLTSANVTLTQATAVADAVQARFDQGLATRPDLLLAIQERARAAFDVQDANGRVADARARLAESIGITPTEPLKVADLASVPLPTELPATVEQVMDRSLVRRPDLAERLAVLRAREAELKQARAQFMPQVGVSGSVGGDIGRYKFGDNPTVNFQREVYGVFLNFSWTLFDGFERENRVREVTSQRGAAEAEVASLELRVIRQVWQAYIDVKTSLAKREFALALLAAAQEAYDAALESYRSAGLATVLDVLAAERDLARARFTEIQSRADVLRASSALVYAAGD